jgi:hypothetical protein
MIPPKSPGKKKTQQSVLFSFFKRKRRRGRPKNSNKKDETCGRPRSTATSTKEPQSVTVTVARPPQSYRKQQRINWSKGNDCIRLAQAVADWDGKTEATKDENGEPLVGMAAFATIHEIPPKTFAKYACQDKSKCRVLGSHVGMPQLLLPDQSQFVADVFIRADCGNQGKSHTSEMRILKFNGSRIVLQRYTAKVRLFLTIRKLIHNS